MKNKTLKAEVAPAQSGQHTPGPWQVAVYGDFANNNPEHINIMFGGKKIASIRTQANNSTAENYKEYNVTASECQANARLIAAAPELLEALKAVSQLDYLNEHNALANQVSAAIAKAEGRE